MSDRCPHSSNCEMYGLFNLKSALKVWQLKYCEGIFTECARYQRSRKGERVPLTLLPNGRMLYGEDEEEGKKK